MHGLLDRTTAPPPSRAASRLSLSLLAPLRDPFPCFASSCSCALSPCLRYAACGSEDRRPGLYDLRSGLAISLGVQGATVRQADRQTGRREEVGGEGCSLLLHLPAPFALLLGKETRLALPRSLLPLLCPIARPFMKSAVLSKYA